MILLPRAGIWGDSSQPVERQACAAWPRSHPTARIALEVGERGCTLSRWPPSVTGIDVDYADTRIRNTTFADALYV